MAHSVYHKCIIRFR